MSAHDLAVIVTTHNRAAQLDEALSCLSRQVWDNGTWEVLVVDNNSTDSTSEVLQRWEHAMPTDFRAISALERQGPSYARNTGVAATAAVSVAFLDDDDLVADGWVAAIGNALRTEELVGSRFDHHRLNSPAVANAANVQAQGLGRAFGSPAVSGGGLGCRRSLWQRVGGSDEGLRFGEDIDFSLRATAAGAAPAFCTDAVYHPRLSEQTAAAFRRGRQHGLASVDLFVRHGRANGATTDPIGLLAKVAVGFITRIPSLADRRVRVAYAEQLGRRIGRLHGSLRQRVWYP